jgi:hypothetical protein
MIIKKVFLCTIGVALFLCIGCSFDTSSIIDHPTKVNEGQQFEVSLYNQFQHITNGSTISMDIIRDSLHVSVGASQGWTVESARYYVARNWDIVSLASRLNDTVALALAIRDSSIAFKARATAMIADPGFAGQFSGRIYQAADQTKHDSMIVVTDSIPWTSFRGYTNILYTQGTPVDTLSINDLTGDTTGVAVMPVFAWVTLRAPSASRQDTLFYFSKTAAMPPLTDTADIDIGAMSYAAITVGTAAVIASKTVSKAQGISIRMHPRSDALFIDLGALAAQTTALGIYNLSGACIADLSHLLNRSTGVIHWNTQGKMLKQGMYLLRCKTKNGMVAKPVQLIR